MVAPAAGPDELPIDVDLIKVLASDSRRDILRHLGERRKTLTELSDALGLKKATILEHLQKLVAAGLIRRLDGDERLWVYYELTPRGARLVRPGRTRFYLIMAGTAAAALLLGAVVATAFFADPLGGEPSSPMTDDRAAFQDDDASPATVVALRGIDDGAQLELPRAGPPAGTLLLMHEGGGPATPLGFEDRRANLSAAQLDALPAGRYRSAIASEVGNLSIPLTLVVAEPPIAAFPLVFLEGRTLPQQLVVTPPGEVADEAPLVLLHETPVNVSMRGRLLDLQLPAQSAGELDLQVGRLHRLESIVLPHAPVVVTHDNGTLRAATTPNATLHLNDALLGTADADGTLVAPWPADGEHTLRVVREDGAERTHGILVGANQTAELAPRLRIELVDSRFGSNDLRIRVDVHNDGPAPEFVTLAARANGELLASAWLEVPARTRVDALLAAPIPMPPFVEVEAHAARSTPPAVTFQHSSTADGADRPNASASPLQGWAASDAGGGAFAYDMYGGAPHARATLGSPTAPTMTGGTPAADAAQTSAQVPGPALALVLGAVLVAFLARRKHR